MHYNDFGENLRQLRKSQNLTQKDLGGKIGLSKAVVSKYENGMGYPSFDILLRIAQFFGVTTDHLLGAAREKSIDASGLSDSQIAVIHQLIAEFRAANEK